MSIGLSWLGIGVGTAGFITTHFLAAGTAPKDSFPMSGSERKRAWFAAALTLVITLLFWAVSMQRHAPFSPGQRLGWGFLIGGVAGAAACLLSVRFDGLVDRAGSTVTSQLGLLATAFFSLAIVSLTYLLFSGYPQPALMGMSIGAAMGAVISYFSRAVTRSSEVPASPDASETWALFSITLAASILLAVEHFGNGVSRQWWSLPILMGATVCASTLAAVEIGRTRWFAGLKGVGLTLAVSIDALATIILAALYSWKVVGDWHLLGVSVVGTLAAASIAWLAASAERKPDQASTLELASLAVIVVVALAVAAFKLWSGLGIGLGLISAWAVALPAIGIRSEDNCVPAISRLLVSALVLGLGILLFRVFEQYYRPDLSMADLRIHYTFIAAMLGAVIPFIFTSSMIRLRTLSERCPTGMHPGRRGGSWAVCGSLSGGHLYDLANPRSFGVYVWTDSRSGFLDARADFRGRAGQARSVTSGGAIFRRFARDRRSVGGDTVRAAAPRFGIDALAPCHCAGGRNTGRNRLDNGHGHSCPLKDTLGGPLCSKTCF